jgi:hypothetical protein
MEYNEIEDVEMAPAAQIISRAMFDKALEVIKSMGDYEVISAEQELSLVGWVAASLKGVECGQEVQSIEVFKGLDYGPATTDVSKLTAGGALVAQAMDKRRKYDMAIAKSLVSAGWRPWGTSENDLSGEDVLKGLTEHFLALGWDEDSAALMGQELAVALLED